MKRKNILYLILSLILAVIMSIEFVSCNSNEKVTEPSETKPSESLSDTGAPTEKVTEKRTAAIVERTDVFAQPDVDAYDIQKYMYPIWKSDTSFAEAAFVRENAEGNVEPIQLLYPIDEIISVRSANLKTVYTEGVDYRITEDGKLEIIEGGAIPVLEYSRYYLPVYSGENKGQLPAADGSGGAYIHSETTRESMGMTEWTLAVTYKHSAESNISAPGAKSEKFEKLIEKLENREEIKVAFYGDSITVGWAATGYVHRSPRCPSFTNLVCDSISQTYGVYIERQNWAVSGKNASWGADRQNLKQVYGGKPDLVILAFGMNDGVNTDQYTYMQKINYMVESITRQSPDTCIVVVGTMLPNAQVGYTPGTSLLNYHLEYAKLLKDAEEKWDNAAFADVTTVHQQMLEKKVFQDTTSSNTNHPNDYMHRVYAQVIFQTIFGEYGDI